MTRGASRAASTPALCSRHSLMQVRMRPKHHHIHSVGGHDRSAASHALQTKCNKHTLHPEVRAGRPAMKVPLCCCFSLNHPGGVRTGGYPKTAPVCGPLGFQRPADWDLLWSPARSALKAVPVVKAGQLVSAVPGMYSLTKKVSMSGQSVQVPCSGRLAAAYAEK